MIFYTYELYKTNVSIIKLITIYFLMSKSEDIILKYISNSPHKLLFSNILDLIKLDESVFLSKILKLVMFWMGEWIFKKKKKSECNIILPSISRLFGPFYFNFFFLDFFGSYSLTSLATSYYPVGFGLICSASFGKWICGLLQW